MSYYQGDYYQGDYYEGDPFGPLAALMPFAKRMGVKLLTKIRGGAGTALARRVGGPLMKLPGAGPIVRVGERVGGAIVRHPVLSAAGAAGVAGALGGRMSVGMGRRRVPRAFGKRRRMNPYNPRALRRAVRRAQAFSRMAKRVLRFTSPHPVRGRAHFKFPRRRKKI